jgi:phage terminase small subunit
MTRTARKDKNLQPGQPLKPLHLSDRASLAWDRLVGELSASGIVATPAHRTALCLASTIAADIAEAWEVVKRDGAYITTKAGVVAHPASKRMDALRRDYIKVLVMLGVRTAVVEPPVSDVPTLADVLGG